MKYLIITLILLSAFPAHAIINVDGVSYTKEEYDIKKSKLIVGVRNRNIDASTRDLIILLNMMIRECAGKQLTVNGRLTWDILLNKFEKGC